MRLAPANRSSTLHQENYGFHYVSIIGEHYVDRYVARPKPRCSAKPRREETQRAP